MAVAVSVLHALIIVVKGIEMAIDATGTRVAVLCVVTIATTIHTLQAQTRLKPEILDHAADDAACAGKRWLAELRPGQSEATEIAELIEAVHDTLTGAGSPPRRTAPLRAVSSTAD